MQPKTFKVRNDQGLELTIRDIRVEEAPIMASWMRSSETALTIAHMFAIPEYDEVDWIKKAYSDPRKLVMGIEWEEKLVGSWTAGIEGHTATTGSIIGDKNHRGKGIGSLAHMFRTWYLFTNWSNPCPIWKLKSHVMWDETQNLLNHASKRALEKSGYIQTGMLYGEIFRQGKISDIVHLECFNPMYFGEDNARVEVSNSVKKVKEVLQFIETHIERV